jgi:ribulose-phosphate 3-epimerase
MDKLDMILLMSVNPGFGGQSFIPQTLEKCRQVRQLIDASGKDIRLEIDGGVKIDNIREVAAAGADTFVAGSAPSTERHPDEYVGLRDTLKKIKRPYLWTLNLTFDFLLKI